MQLAVAPFMWNFSVSVLCTGPKRRSVYMHLISLVSSVCHRQLAFEFSVYVVIYVEMLTRIFLVVKLLSLCERLRREGKSSLTCF